MRFEEVLPALRDGRAIRSRGLKSCPQDICIHIVNGVLRNERGAEFFLDAVEAMEMDWEIVAEPLTNEQLIAEWERKAAQCSQEAAAASLLTARFEGIGYAAALRVCIRQLRERKL